MFCGWGVQGHYLGVTGDVGAGGVPRAWPWLNSGLAAGMARAVTRVLWGYMCI